MIGLLFVQYVDILRISRASRIPLEYAKHVLDAEAFERFTWRRFGFKSLNDSVYCFSTVPLSDSTNSVKGERISDVDVQQFPDALDIDDTG